MGDKVWVQCQCCGETHQTKVHNVSEDDLYITTRCPCCRDETKHLWCGENREDVYMYYNANLDPKYF